MRHLRIVRDLDEARPNAGACWPRRDRSSDHPRIAELAVIVALTTTICLRTYACSPRRGAAASGRGESLACLGMLERAAR